MSLPSGERARQRRRCWFRASTSSKYVVTRSQCGYFLGHWSAKFRRSVRCSGEGCPFCASGLDPRAFVYVFVEDPRDGVMVWELGSRLFDLAVEIDEAALRGQACRIQVWREGTAVNSAVSARCLEHLALDELDISAFVNSLGKVPEGVESQLSSSRENAFQHPA